MIHWSKYNLIFESAVHGHFLYNSLSNTLAKLNEKTYSELKKIKQSPNTYEYSNRPDLLIQLLLSKVLVNKGEEESLLNTIKMRRLYHNYTNSYLALTILPTLACNFKCEYCYQALAILNQIELQQFFEEHGIGPFTFEELQYAQITNCSEEPLGACCRIQAPLDCPGCFSHYDERFPL